jgi:endonuclease V-like protein UPF0215 family
MFRSIKPEIRIIGWDDVHFTFKDRETLIIGVVCRGGTQLDGVIVGKITVDGNDSTGVIAETVNKSKHGEQLRIIMLDGITFGGFNIVDINSLYKKTGMPVIVVIRDNPDMAAIRKSLSKFADADERWNLIEKAGKIRKIEVKNKVLKGRRTMYYQHAGIEGHDCEKIINLTAVNSAVPEPVRMAHIICSGVKDAGIR